jgi:hypothetical protein
MPTKTICQRQNQLPQELVNQIAPLTKNFPIDIEILESKYHDLDEIKMFPMFKAGERVQIHGFEIFNQNISYWLGEDSFYEDELPKFRILPN